MTNTSLLCLEYVGSSFAEIKHFEVERVEKHIIH